MIDNLINTYFQQAKDFFKPPVEQETMWYGLRPIGEDYLPPFAYRTNYRCQGIELDLPEDQQEEIDHYLFLSGRWPLSNAAKTPGHKDGDFTDFIANDLQKYDMYGEFLYDTEFAQITDTQKYGDLVVPLIRKAHFKKRKCQELDPNNGNLYGDPYDYYEIDGDFQWWSLYDMFR